MARLARRSLPLAGALTALLLVATAALAVTAGTGKFSVTPNIAGKPSRATLDITPRKAANPRSVIQRVVRGAKFDGRAVAKRCSPQQANSNSCPAGSRIGGGTVNATVKSTTNAFPPVAATVNVDLYLAPPVQPGDVAGVVVHFKEPQTNTQGHATGRILFHSTGTYGYETRFSKLDTALKPPAGTTAHVDKSHLTYGVHRTVTKTVNGKPTQVTYYLLRNPPKCNGSWPYQLRVGYPSGAVDNDDGSVPCTS